MGPNQANPYEFIVNNGQPNQPKTGGTLKSRIMVVAGGLLILIILAVVVSTVLSSAGKAAQENLRATASNQERILELAEQGAKDAISVETRSYANTALLTVRTDQQKLARYVPETKQKTKSSAASQLDTMLEAAKANNRYDEAIEETMAEYLQSYKANLKKTYDSVSNEDARAILSTAYENADTLLAAEQE